MRNSCFFGYELYCFKVVSMVVFLFGECEPEKIPNSRNRLFQSKWISESLLYMKQLEKNYYTRTNSSWESNVNISKTMNMVNGGPKRTCHISVLATKVMPKRCIIALSNHLSSDLMVQRTVFRLRKKHCHSEKLLVSCIRNSYLPIANDILRL